MLLTLLFSTLALANASCPDVYGHYVCDEKLPGLDRVIIDIRADQNTGKSEFLITSEWGRESENYEVYRPDEPMLHGNLPNGGEFKKGEYCEQQQLTHEDFTSGVLPNGKLRAVRESESYGKTADGLLVVTRNHEEFLDGKIVRQHAASSQCTPVKNR